MKLFGGCMITEKRNALRSLIESSGGVHLTAYLVNKGNLSDMRAQLTQTLKTAANNIRSVMPRGGRAKFLKPIRALVDDARVLGTLRGNVGIFRNQNSFRVLHIPVEVEALCSVATTFHVKPLLRWQQSDRDFLLVGIEKGAVHLYQGSQHYLRHVDTLMFNRDIAEGASLEAKLAFWIAADSEKQMLGEMVPWLENWLTIHAKNSKPKLFFAGRKKITDSLKFELSYRNIAKNPSWSSFKTKQLGKICAEIRQVLSHDIERYIERSFIEFVYSNNLDLTETNIFHIAKAAIQGRVKRMMIAGDVNVFGQLNPTTGELTLHKADLNHEDDCVLDDLAQKVLAQGGKVIVATQQEIPGGHSILAITDPHDPEMRIEKALPQEFRHKWQPGELLAPY